MDNHETTKTEGLTHLFTMQAAELTGIPLLCTIAGCRRDRRCGMKDFVKDEPFCMSLASVRDRRRIAEIVRECIALTSTLQQGRDYHLEPRGQRRRAQDDALRIMSGLHTTDDDPPARWKRLRRRYVKAPLRPKGRGQRHPVKG
ncbi:hypothetical protein J5J10_17145 [Ciceribacter sp. L1K23]|uniref:hypothetical protein n=1 Tax=Ciceribacter sp. L1K23 TaxID=2820276 RepID=UPI001B83E7EB|nr:hypothetical protein [Ciceribacter sp. L1K23]MBR0557417.1 hypothetical protein [Ciceribacter sp. L1K23]